MRKRKVNYPVARTSKRPAPTTGLAADAARQRSTVATINLAALDPRSDLGVGDAVRITAGLRAGEMGVFEARGTGPIPTATLRTADGRKLRARLVDLERIEPEKPAPDAP